MTYQSITPTLVNSHQVDLAIVEFFGLGSVMDIDTVTKTGTRYSIILEDGTRKIASVAAITDIINQVKSTVPQVGVIYKIAKRWNKRNSISEFTLVDIQGHQVTHIERFASSIWHVGDLVLINENREIELA